MNIVVNEKLQHGYYIVQKVQNNGTAAEYTLVKMSLTVNGDVKDFNEFFSSKFKPKVMSYYLLHLKDDKTIVKNFSELIKDLTIEELERLLPSYYQPEIMERIEELKRNAVTKVKRSTKGTTKKRGRSRNIQA